MNTMSYMSATAQAGEAMESHTTDQAAKPMNNNGHRVAGPPASDEVLVRVGGSAVGGAFIGGALGGVVGAAVGAALGAGSVAVLTFLRHNDD